MPNRLAIAVNFKKGKCYRRAPEAQEPLAVLAWVHAAVRQRARFVGLDGGSVAAEALPRIGSFTAKPGRSGAFANGAKLFSGAN